MNITTCAEAPLDGFPWIRPTDFLKTLGRLNDLGQILGGRRSIQHAEKMLNLFWSRYRAIYPKFELFGEVRAGKKQLGQCIPMFIHGDEGTTYKRGGILILSLQGALGEGTSKRCPEAVAKCDYPSKDEEMRLNFLRPGRETRMLILVCPKDRVWYVTFYCKVILKCLVFFLIHFVLYVWMFQL